MKRKHPLAKCEECPLFEAGEYVPSCGPPKARIAVVGEAPGYNESRTGTPFTGQSGKLLDTILKHYKIKRSEIFLSNACLCREPNGENPTKTAINACRPRLISEIKDHNVEVLVGLGNSASESILCQTGINKLRIGPGRTSQYLPGVRVIPTVHPAAALRQSDIFPNIVADFGKINNAPPDWEPPEYIVAYNEEEALTGLRLIDAMFPEFISVDIEVDIEKDTSFDHPNQYGMLCVGIGWSETDVLVLSEEAMQVQTVKDRLAKLMRKYDVTTQNGKFDIAGLYHSCGPLKISFDTMLEHYLLDERPGIHDLEQMGVELLGAPSWKTEINRYKKPGQGYGVIPRHVLYKYNAYDCNITYKLKLLLWKQIQEQKEEDTYFLKAGRMVKGKRLEDAHELLIDASNELVFVELNGIAVDKDYIESLSEILLDELQLKEIVLNLMLPKGKSYDAKTGGVNPRSPMQLKKVFRDFGMFTQSTDADTCKLIIEMKGIDSQIGKFCINLLEHRKQTKDYGTYVEGIRKRIYLGTTRVYPSFLLHGTTEGRLSCRNPNLQNIPRKSAIRRLFVPSKDGNVFVQTDYSQAELRVLCWLAGDTYFTDIFNEGIRDVFDELSEGVLFPQYPKHIEEERFKELLNVPQFNQLVPEKYDDWNKAYQEVFKQVRSKWVKPFVYGLAYGRTEYGIASDIEIGLNVQEAKVIMDKFMSVIPEIVQWQKDIKKLVGDGNDLVTPFGRHRRFHLITKQNYEDTMKQALAFVPASTSSDLCLQAFTRIRRDLVGIGWVRNLVHDSVLAECHKDDAEEVKAIMEKHMLDSAQELVGDYVKFAVDTKVGKDWGSV